MTSPKKSRLEHLPLPDPTPLLTTLTKHSAFSSPQNWGTLTLQHLYALTLLSPGLDSRYFAPTLGLGLLSQISHSEERSQGSEEVGTSYQVPWMLLELGPRHLSLPPPPINTHVLPILGRGWGEE